MTKRLDATILDKLTVRPSWTRTVLIRRVIAGILVAVAVTLLIRGNPSAERTDVVVAVRDLTPGIILTAADLEVVHVERKSIPDGVVTTVLDATGHTLAGPVRSGEMVTDVRLLGPRLAGAALGDADARVVPIKLADASVTELLREGDRVDVLTVATEDNASRTAVPVVRMLASGAIVVLVSPEDPKQRQRERIVLLALPVDDATTVAAASLVNAITVTFH